MLLGLNKIFEIVLLFCVIFTFRVPVLGTSSLLLALILLFLFILKFNRGRRNLREMLSNKDFIKIVACLLGIIGITFFATVLHGVYDFSLLKTVANQLFNLILVILYLSIFYKKGKNYNYFLNILSICFAAQGLFMIVSLLSPSFKVLMESTQALGVIERSLFQYGGMRNLGFGFTQFYGLNALLGIGFIITTFLFIADKKIKYLIRLGFIFIGIFLSGRTALVAVILSVLFFFLNNKFSIKKDYKTILYLIPIIIGVFVGISFFIDFIPQSIKDWAFEFYYNYESGGGLATRSTDTLFDRMYFLPDDEIVLFGSGQYTTTDGRYFMHTDAGFMRTLLYYGFIGVLLFTFYHFLILNTIKKYLNGYISQRINKYFFIFLAVFSIVLNIKGEFLGFLIISQNVFFLMVLSLILTQNKKYVN